MKANYNEKTYMSLPRLRILICMNLATETEQQEGQSVF